MCECIRGNVFPHTCSRSQNELNMKAKGKLEVPLSFYFGLPLTLFSRLNCHTRFSTVGDLWEIAVDDLLLICSRANTNAFWAIQLTWLTCASQTEIVSLWALEETTEGREESLHISLFFSPSQMAQWLKMPFPLIRSPASLCGGASTLLINGLCRARLSRETNEIPGCFQSRTRTTWQLESKCSSDLLPQN